MLVTVTVGALAVWEIVEVWHHGEIFATARSKVETWGESESTVKRFLCGALTCPFCLSVWVGMVTSITLTLLPDTLPVFAGLALARAANALNDLTHAYSRTPKNVFDAGKTDSAAPVNDGVNGGNVA